MTTKKELITIDNLDTDLPAYLQTEVAQAAEENAALAAGISTGFPDSIKMSGGRFKLVRGNGEEALVKAKDLFEGEYLAVAVLGARPEFEKIFYASAYDPSKEAQAPDCWSLDGKVPDASIAEPQSKTCPSCPQNTFNSAVDAKGNQMKGKACRDQKILAVRTRWGIFRFAIPPNSLRNWGTYVSDLTARGLPVRAVKTLIGFSDDDPNKFVFGRGGYWTEDQFKQLQKDAASSEVDEILHPSGMKVLPAVAAPAPAPAQEPAKAEPEPAKEPVKDKPKPTPKAATKKAEPDETDQLGLGGEAADDGDVSDAELDNVLGL